MRQSIFDLLCLTKESKWEEIKENLSLWLNSIIVIVSHCDIIQELKKVIEKFKIIF